MSEKTRQRRLHAFVSGRVQGVGFRYHVLTEIQTRCPNVCGKVRNIVDGRVEVIAEGSEDDLHIILNILRDGPRWSVVENVHEQWGEPRGDLGTGFDVSHYESGYWSA